MFYADIALVGEQIAKYGLMKPLVDLGGQAKPVVANYELLPASPFVKLAGRPFDHIDQHYIILNPEKGDAPIENLGDEQFGTVLCLSVLEHVENPFDVFDGLYECLKPGGLLILSTVFSFRYHPAPVDYWRFTPECLKMLAERVGFKVLDFGWHVRALLVQAEEYNLVRGVYLTARKEA